MYKRLRQAGSRWSYANALSTLALFVSLGGASYAAVSLPANSVGPRQLRPGAVLPQALGFPLGLASLTNRQVDDIPGGACNGWPLLPGEPAPPCVRRLRGGLAPGRELTVHLRARTKVAVFAVLDVDNRGVAGTHAEVDAEVVIDRRPGTEHKAVLDGGRSLQLPVVETFALSAGAHTIGLAYMGRYSARGPDVFVGPTSLLALASP